MQLESHATPPRESPQQRYANLHRAIERGLDSDEIWKELAEVSLTIGHGDEAVRCMRRIRGETTRLALSSRLQRLGLIRPQDTAAGSTKAPAASDAGKGGAKAGEDHGLRDHVVDAFQYLFHQHMPWLVLMTTLAFPLVVGLGGFLTAGGSPLLLTAIAALPGLCVVSLVGAMGRQILLASAEGNGDVPPVPGFGELVEAAKRFSADATLVIGSLLLPSLLALWLGAPLTTALPGLLIGAFFVPMAWALRHLRGTLDALSPVVLLRAIARTGTSYVGIAATIGAMFAPAAGVSWIAFGKPVWVQIAIVGPLCVVPLFLSSRLLGTWLDGKRAAIGGVRKAIAKVNPAVAARSTDLAATPRAAQAAPAAPASRRFGAQPASAGATNPRTAQHAATAPRRGASAPQPATARPATARAIEGRKPTARPAETPAASPQPRQPARPLATSAARVVATGAAARAHHGAAARRP